MKRPDYHRSIVNHALASSTMMTENQRTTRKHAACAMAAESLADGPGKRVASASREARSDEAGSVLILAFGFLVAVSLIVNALASWAVNDLTNTANFRYVSAKLYAAQSTTQVDIRASRYTYPPNATSTGYACPGLTPLVALNGFYVADWCVTTLNVGAFTREVTLTACLLPSGTSTLSGPCQISTTTTVPTLLTVSVGFNDTTATSSPASPNCTSSANQSTCGASMSILSWIAQ